MARRSVDGATIIKASVGPMDNNAYIVTCTKTGKSLLIDAANDAERLATLVDESAPNIELIVTTHQHFDHWQALEAIVGKTQSPSAAHDLDAGPLPVRPDTLLAGGDSLDIGDLHFDVIHLRGHTPGSVALAFTAAGVTHLFTGICCSPGSRAYDEPGRIHVADGRPRRPRIRPLPGRYRCLPWPRRRYNARQRTSALAEWRKRGW